VDTKSRLLLVETTSHKKADDVTALLRKNYWLTSNYPIHAGNAGRTDVNRVGQTGSLPPGLALCDEATLKDVLENGGRYNKTPGFDMMRSLITSRPESL
jgi:recombination associated protein RdgC